MDQRILFRCDGGNIPEIGTGHVRRCLLLADYLKRHRHAILAFLMRDDPEGVRLARKAGVHVETFPKHGDEISALKHTLNVFRPDVCVFDCLDTTAEAIAACHQYNAVVVSLDDQGAGLERGDIVINAIREHEQAHYRGPKYVVLPERRETTSDHISKPEGVALFLSFGGYDHAGVTVRTLDVVSRLKNISRITVVTSQPDLVTHWRQQTSHGVVGQIDVLCEPHNFPEILAQADIAMIGGGLTLFEAMRCGVPSLVVAQYQHQLQTALRYQELGATICLGLGTEEYSSNLLTALERLIADRTLRQQMATQGARLVDGEGLQRVADLISFCQLKEWDTTFFGVKIAMLNVARLTEPIMAYTLRTCENWNVDCLYYEADCHHPQSVHLAEQNGFHFVDIRLTFEYHLDADQPLSSPGDNCSIKVREHRLEDMPILKHIAGQSYIHSRYYFDEHFPRKRCQEFYTEWIEKSCCGYVEQVLVAELAGTVAGYITCRLVNRYEGTIELVGVDPAAAGNSIGRALVVEALQWFRSRGIKVVEVVTQGRNYAAQRLYQRCGFVTKKTELWYHKWFNA